MLICRLDFCNFVHVFEGDCCSDLMAWTARSLFNASSFLEKIWSRRSFCNKGESAVGLNGNQSWHRYPRFYVRRSGVEFFTKVHGFHPSCTKSRAHRGCWCSFACWNQQTLRVVRYRTLKIEYNIPLSGLLLLRLPGTWKVREWQAVVFKVGMWRVCGLSILYYIIMPETAVLTIGPRFFSHVQVWTWNCLRFCCPSVYWVERILLDSIKTIKPFSNTTWTRFVSFSWREKTQCGWQNSKRLASLYAVLL